MNVHPKSVQNGAKRDQNGAKRTQQSVKNRFWDRFGPFSAPSRTQDAQGRIHYCSYLFHAGNNDFHLHQLLPVTNPLPVNLHDAKESSAYSYHSAQAQKEHIWKK